MSKLEDGCVINLENGEIEFNGMLVTLRPKTFELLLLLSSKPGEIISKANILENVWSETIVEDQAVFQSINEIRKEFGSSDVIKTYPRRGYSWNYPNTIIKEHNLKAVKSKSSSYFTSTKFIYLAFIASILLITVGILFITPTAPTTITEQSSKQTTSASHEGVLILPFNVEALQESEKWIRFGALQGLINKIPLNDRVTVFQLEDTIEILNRLSISEKSDISNLFKKSGASFILKASISGVPGDYHIVYSVYTPKSVETKSINTKTINVGINALASILNKVLTIDTKIDSEFINNQLKDNLIAKAIQYMEINDNQSALAFLKSANVADKTNVYVNYLIAQIASRLGLFEQALDSTQTALKLINNGANEQYRNRLLYIHGTLLLSRGDVGLAEKILLKAEESSKESKDWLYYSYSQSVLGKIHQINGNNTKAKLYFTSALEYQELLQCPMGVAQSYLNFAEFYLSQHQKDIAMKNFILAKSLIKEQKLQLAEPILKHVKDKFDQYQKTN